MAVKACPLGVKPQFLLASGLPAVGNQLFFYVSGSSTKQNTYTDSTGGSANANPIVLNSLGEPTTQLWFTAGQAYRVVYAPSTDTDPPLSPIWTIDGLTGINDTTLTIDQWVAGPAPTYISATQFTLVGDQTSTFQVGRRVKTTNTGGTIYSRISASAYGVLTTVTVVNDSGTLDAGLSAVSYGLLSASNPSTPLLGALTNSLSGDVSLNNTGNYFDGPVVTQGTAGLWFVIGTVTLLDTGGGATFLVKLGDGTTVISSAVMTVAVANKEVSVSLSGFISAPAGNLRIFARDSTAVTGKLVFNSSGLSKDCTITAIRLA